MHPSSYIASDDILNKALQSNIRTTVHLTDNISKALKCSTESISESGAKLMYPTSYIMQLSNKSAQHPLFETISKQLQCLYNLLQHNQMCPEWITPKLRLIELKINSLMLNQNDTILINMLRHKSPRKKNKSKKLKTCTANRKKHKPVNKTVTKKRTKNIYKKQFKELYAKIADIDSKMNKLHRRLESNSKYNYDKNVKNCMIKKKRKKKQTTYKSDIRKKKQLLLRNKVHKLDTTSKQTNSNILMMKNTNESNNKCNLIHIPSAISANINDKDNEKLLNELRDQTETLNELKQQIKQMKKRENMINSLSMKIHKEACNVNIT
eukprot:554015_1